MDVLVHVDRREGCRRRIAVALELAASSEGRLIGLAVADDPRTPLTKYGPIAANLYGILEAAMNENLGAAEQQFKVATGGSSARIEFRRAIGNAAEQIALHARYADLTVLGQTDPQEEVKDWLDHAVPLIAGGPSLVIPYVGDFSRMGRRPLIAWNGSREAARAVKDAMYFLRRAETVDVLSIATDEMMVEKIQQDAADLCGFLARHQVRAVAHSTLAKDIEVADLLLSRAADLGSDLLVMGAYGHSRFREMVLGGATRGVLRTTPVPVLLSH